MIIIKWLLSIIIKWLLLLNYQMIIKIIQQNKILFSKW